MILRNTQSPNGTTCQHLLMIEEYGGNRGSVNAMQILSKNLLDFLLLVGHGLFGCFPKVAFLHDERSDEWKFGLVEFLTQEGYKILLLTIICLFIYHDFNSFSFFSWSFLSSFTTAIVFSFYR